MAAERQLPAAIREAMNRVVGGYAADVAAGSTSTFETDGGAGLVTVTGEHDLYTSSDLREELKRALGSYPATVVDLTGTTFVDSSIVGVLLDARQTAERGGVGFAVYLGEGAARSVRRIFDITGLTDSLPVESSREQALGSALARRESDS